MNMKLKIILVRSIAGGITLTTGLGIEPPVEDVAPPSAILERAEKKEAIGEEVRAQQGLPFVGLSTAVLPDMVADHVGMEPRSGLIVRMILPGSPADEAGLSVNDIILKADGKVITQPEEFSNVILSRKVGEPLTLSLIHKGKPAEVIVTLGERPVDLMVNDHAPEPMLRGLPQQHVDRLQEMIEKNLQEFGVNPEIGDIGAKVREEMKRALENRVEGRREGLGNKDFEFQKNSTVRMMDNQGSVEIKSANGSTEVTVRDKAEKISWNGPWDTAQDKAAAPDAIRDRIEKLDSGKGGGFEFHFGGLRQNAPGGIDN